MRPIRLYRPSVSFIRCSLTDLCRFQISSNEAERIRRWTIRFCAKKCLNKIAWSKGIDTSRDPGRTDAKYNNLVERN
jgi:hypothetical protein